MTYHQINFTLCSALMVSSIGLSMVLIGSFRSMFGSVLLLIGRAVCLIPFMRNHA